MFFNTTRGIARRRLAQRRGTTEKA